MSFFRYSIKGPDGKPLVWDHFIDRNGRRVTVPLWRREQYFTRIVRDCDPTALDYQGRYAITWQEPLWRQERKRREDELSGESATQNYGTLRITRPSPTWLAMAMHGGMIPPVQVYWALQYDEAQPGFKHHTRGHLLHETPPMRPLTEEEAMEYLAMMVVPQRVWTDRTQNSRLMRIVPIESIPNDRTHRNAWRLENIGEHAI